MTEYIDIALSDLVTFIANIVSAESILSLQF